MACFNLNVIVIYLMLINQIWTLKLSHKKHIVDRKLLKKTFPNLNLVGHVLEINYIIDNVKKSKF